MAGLPYPAELPRPIGASFRPAPRVRRSDVPGAVNQAAREREFRGTAEHAWLLTDAEANLWRDWYVYELLEGGRLFSATWPVPAGYSADTVRKFIAEPTWTRQARGLWRVTATTEVHGRRATLQGGFDARAAGWPGSIEYAVIDEAGALVRDVSVPWSWDSPDLTWGELYAWDGQIAYVYTADLGAVRTTYLRILAAGVRTPIVERQASNDGSTWGPLVEVPAVGAPERFEARHVRIRITATGDTATLTAARISIYQRT